MKQLLVVAVVFLSAACGQPPPGKVTPRAVRVVTAAPRPVVPFARYGGVLEAGTQLDLAFRVPGRVARVGQVSVDGGVRELQEGDVVRVGDVLAALDLADLRRQQSAAASAVSGAAAQVRTARTNLGQAEKEVQRARRLFAGGDLSQAELDRAEAAFAAASSSLAALEAQEQGRVDQLALTRSALADATLASPITGVLSRKAIDPGELVAPNVPLFSVVDLSELRLVFGVPDTRVNELHVGAALPVEVEAFPGRHLVGMLAKIAPTADPLLRTYAVELRLSGEPALRPGMSATVRLGEAARDALVLPLAAVVRVPAGEGYGVFVLGADDVVTLTPVTVADLLENDVVLSSGLEVGQRVVTDGAAFLRTGERVVVTP
ncbi:MAG: efflux RND transporter periplasmic adaptor subunit [Myxococcota bacterium]